MEEFINVEVTDNESKIDKTAIWLIGGLAGLVASNLAEKGYKFAIKTYRLRKATT